MDAFNKQIQEIERQVDKLSRLLKKLKTIFSAIKKGMEKDIDEVGKIARSVKAKLEVMNNDITASDQQMVTEGALSLKGSNYQKKNAVENERDEDQPLGICGFQMSCEIEYVENPLSKITDDGVTVVGELKGRCAGSVCGPLVQNCNSGCFCLPFGIFVGICTGSCC
ncbi:hypothetical protein FNV43_RR00450 [Rhamnella rubrinervis]|uniref:Syntaxin N-terminal domain-containing protein n=1 Tax=Rhamnella rubrinervis TaxID=2594499 RepID=A0A8K0HPK5_9ROSA|nr:hypothetical protein FNV43_RR00450 [Rhamnella rubrinervis]